MKNIYSYIMIILSLIYLMHAKEPKTLVLIIASDNQPLYNELQKIWRSYMDSDPNHFDCYFLKNKEDLEVPVKLDNKTIWCRAEEQVELPGLLNKTLISLNFLKDSLDNYDFVIRTNLSSFWIFKNLLSFLKTSPTKNFYSGIIHGKNWDFLDGKGWICGAGIILSTDLAITLIEHRDYLLNPNNWHGAKHDDTMIAQFFHDRNIQLSLSNYLEISSCKDLSKFYQHAQNNVFHIRVKTSYKNRLPFELKFHKFLLETFYMKKHLFK